MPSFKPIEMIMAAAFILAVLGSTWAYGYSAGKGHVQKQFDKYKLEQAAAVEEKRATEQDKADTLDEEAAKQIQDLMVKNAELQERIDAETTKPDYDCIIPDAGIKLHNDAIRAGKG